MKKNEIVRMEEEEDLELPERQLPAEPEPAEPTEAGAPTSPNKIMLKSGTIEVAIESSDESTEAICNVAMHCMGKLLEASAPVAQPQPEPLPTPDTETTGDLDDQKNFEKLMGGLA